MSPESILRHEYSAASDAYSFGVAAWEVLSLQPEPYPSHRPLEAAIRAAQEPAFRPAIPPFVPAPLGRLLTRCWAHQARDRPSFARILADLERMEAHLQAQMHKHAQATHTVTAAAAAAAGAGAGAGASAGTAASAPFDAWDPECWLEFGDNGGDSTSHT